jgi:hypothetical protein
VLGHATPSALPLLVLRLVAGALLRALGLLLLRAPREGWAELAALAATVGRPGRLRRARARRDQEATVPRSRLRPLLAPRWLPLRHALDEVGHLGAAVARELTAHDGSWWRRLRTSPLAWALLLLVVVSAVAVRDLLGGGRLVGGALLPAPESAWKWWETYRATTHDVGSGSTASAPAYLLPLAVAGTLLLGSASAVVDLLVLGVVPLAAVGAYRFLRRLTGDRAVSVWGATAYGVLPVVGGAFGQGRFGTLVAAGVLPWLAASALRLTDPDEDRRRRAAWRTALWLALATAFAPQLWWAALVVTVVAVADLLRRGRADEVAPWLVPAPAAAVLLLPWWLPALVERRAGVLLDEAGLSATGLLSDVAALDLLGGRTVTAGAAPGWVALAVPLLAVAALLGPASRRRVLAAWAVAVLALAWLWLLAADGRQWLGLPLLVAHGAWITAAAAAAAGLRTGGRLAWRGAALVAAAGAGALALVLPAGALAWWALAGPDPEPPLATPGRGRWCSPATPQAGTTSWSGGAHRSPSARSRCSRRPSRLPAPSRTWSPLPVRARSTTSRPAGSPTSSPHRRSTRCSPAPWTLFLDSPPRRPPTPAGGHGGSSGRRSSPGPTRECTPGCDRCCWSSRRWR